MGMKAYKCECWGVIGFTMAESAGKARYTYLLGARDAGHNVKFADIRVTRAPEYDEYELPTTWAIGERHVKGRAPWWVKGKGG